MTNLDLSLATIDYFDRFRPILLGRLQPTGCTLRPITFSPPEIGELFSRVAQGTEYDIAEFSLASYLRMRSSGDQRWTALPVFPSRAFRLREIYVRRGGSITSPKDLNNCRIGVPEFGMTAAVWVRGILHEEYGVDWASSTWVTGPLAPHSSYRPRFGAHDDEPVAIEPLAEGQSLEGELLSGGIDALVSIRTPEQYGPDDSAPIARLFPDADATDRAWFNKTGIFPIMHVLVVRTELLDAHPWLARELYRCFVAARDEAWIRLRNNGAQAVGLPWIAETVDATVADFGRDPYQYGFEANLHVLEKLLEYSGQQGLLGDKESDLTAWFPAQVQHEEMIE